MSEATGRQRSAIVFGARNLGRAVIETLIADGWAVAGVARSQATLDGVTEAGGLALQADVTDPASVYAALQEVAAAHGGVDLALNAASAYGGDRTGPVATPARPRRRGARSRAPGISRTSPHDLQASRGPCPDHGRQPVVRSVDTLQATQEHLP